MSPYQINILLHYHCIPGDDPMRDKSPNFWDRTVGELVALGLMERCDTGRQSYQLTDRGTFYVEDGICRVPLPLQTFYIPERS